MNRILPLAISVSLLSGASCGLFGHVHGQVTDTAHSAHETTTKVKTGVKAGTKLYNDVSELTKDMDDQQEYWLGRSVATSILDQYHYQYKDEDSIKAAKLAGITAYVNQVGNVVANAAMKNRKDDDRPNPYDGWHFVVLDADDINAFAAPGGFILITAGAVRAAKSEDELACVLAHEVSHVMRGHALKGIKGAHMTGAASDAFQVAGVMSTEQLQEVANLMQQLIDSMLNGYKQGWSKDAELEADVRGTEIAAKAGYDPAGLGRFLETLKKKQAGAAAGGGQDDFHTYPAVDERIGKLKGVKAGTVSPARKDRFVAAQHLLG